MVADEVMVGVDVSRARLDVALRPRGENFSVGNDAAGVAQLLARIEQLAAGGGGRGERRTAVMRAARACSRFRGWAP